MTPQLLSNEVASSLGAFFSCGSGPSHTAITNCFMACGLSDKDTYNPDIGKPNKMGRVQLLCRTAREHSDEVAVKALDQLLMVLRDAGTFSRSDEKTEEWVANLRRALWDQGVELDDEGRLHYEQPLDLETGGRQALDEQLARLRRNVEDPGALLGGAKELLESICKFVLEEQKSPPDQRLSFDQLLNTAMELLKLQPKEVDTSQPVGKQLRTIYGSAKSTALAINGLRNLQGTGHGRTLPTGISKETGRYVIREATHVAELLLSTHDRQMGRGS